MIFNNSGGGQPLNFKVVGGTTQPTSPTENMIWVNTYTEITSWQFAADDPNLLDYIAWVNGVGVANGTKTINSDASITLTADANGDCYTQYGSYPSAAFPVTPGKSYVLEWDWSGNYGYVYVFKIVDSTTSTFVRSLASEKRLEFIAPEGCKEMSFRLGVSTANASATYSNVRITEKERAFEVGSVWISTGSSSPVGFNALKKNGIQVYPMSAKQYVSGAWVNKTAQSYQSSAWVDWWDGTLYEYGAFHDITNGYSAVKGNSANTVTEEATGLNLYVDTYTGTHVIFNNKINLSGVESLTLTFDGLDTPYNGSTIKLMVASNKIASYSDTIQTLASATFSKSSDSGPTSGTVTVNVSAVDEGYVYCSFVTTGNYNKGNVYFREVKAVLA